MVSMDGSGGSTEDTQDEDGTYDSDGSLSNTPNGKTPLGSPRQAADGSIKTPVVVPEVVWENQRVMLGQGDSAVWSPVAFESAGGIAAFYSANRGILGHAISEVVPARLLNKPHLWLKSAWEVDRTLPGCDEEGWIYAGKFGEFDSETGGLSESSLHGEHSSWRMVRRRRVFRKRRIDGSDLSWFQELLDCGYVTVERSLCCCLCGRYD